LVVVVDDDALVVEDELLDDDELVAAPPPVAPFTYYITSFIINDICEYTSSLSGLSI
jgi:hypothetical protein